MWRKLPYSTPIFISYATENGYRIYVTDYINIWWVHYTENDFLNLLKRCNDDLEMESDNQLLQLGLKMFCQPEDLKKLNLTFECKSLKISMVMSCGFPIYLDMKLTEGSREMFYKYVTQKLLKTVHDLKTSEKELRTLLIKKDTEIGEYKNEADVRLAMYLKTNVYRDDEHMDKHKIYEKHFGISEVSKCLLENMIAETEDQVIVKQENVEVDLPKLKIEPDSQHIVKNEVETCENETQNLSNSRPVKMEIKNDSHDIISPRKKRRIILKI